jgi:hypothetical protein
MFFFEKKNQKTFPLCTAPARSGAAQMDEVFLLLFVHKKKILAPSSLSHPTPLGPAGSWR